MEYIINPTEDISMECGKKGGCPDEVIALYAVIIPCQGQM